MSHSAGRFDEALLNRHKALRRKQSHSPLISPLLLRILAAITCLALFAYALASFLAAMFLTVPLRNFDPIIKPSNVGLIYQDVQFLSRVEKLMITAWYIPQPDSPQAIIMVHDRNSSRTDEYNQHGIDVAQALHAQGFAVLMIDLHGHGESEDGHLSFGFTEKHDIEAAVDWLIETHEFRPGSIGVIGVGMGAAAGILATAEDRDIGAMVADSSFAELDPILQANWTVDTGLPDFMRLSTLYMANLIFGYDTASVRPIDSISRIAPRGVLLIHAEADCIIPIDHAEQLHSADPTAEMWMIPSAQHGQTYQVDPKAYTGKVSEFFKKNLN